MSKISPATGGCLCGAVRYQAEGPPLRAVICHCNQCRRQTGSALPSFVAWPRERIHLTKGTPAVYRASGFASREFCRDCGSPIFWRRDGSGDLAIYLGTLDHPEAMRAPQIEIWAEHRAPWLPAMPGMRSYVKAPDST